MVKSPAATRIDLLAFSFQSRNPGEQLTLFWLHDLQNDKTVRLRCFPWVYTPYAIRIICIRTARYIIISYHILIKIVDRTCCMQLRLPCSTTIISRLYKQPVGSGSIEISSVHSGYITMSGSIVCGSADRRATPADSPDAFVSANQRVKHTSLFCSFVASTEHIIFTSDR